MKQKVFILSAIFVFLAVFSSMLIFGEGKTGQIEKFGNMEFCYIPGGTFTMGSPESEEYRSSDEKQHKVTLSPFWMGKYEVTQKQYSEVMGTNPSYFVGTGQDLSKLPVERVSWYDAIEFCNKLS